jgi:branched-subunit amino acid transport protein
LKRSIGDGMRIWLVMLIGGLITFGMRFSFIFLFGKFHIPETVRKALHYVPPAVLSAIVFPELLLNNGALNLSFTNDRLLAGLVALAIAWFTKNTLITILTGMISLLILRFFL